MSNNESDNIKLYESELSELKKMTKRKNICK